MESPIDRRSLPDSDTLDVFLTHPTHAKSFKIWTDNAASWSGSISLLDYLQEQSFLATIPLAKNAGMITWDLVVKGPPQDHRPIDSL